MKRLAFSDDMMRAIAANPSQKSMTRRPEKRATPDAKGRMFWKFYTEDPNGLPAPSIRWDGNISVLRPRFKVGEFVAATCAYIQNGDKTELHYRFANTIRVKEEELKPFKYAWKTSRIMPAALAPFVLRITEVKAERLGEITDADAEREGALWWWQGRREMPPPTPPARASDAFFQLWLSVYPKKNRHVIKNEWVWAYGFEVAERRI